MLPTERLWSPIRWQSWPLWPCIDSNIRISIPSCQVLPHPLMRELAVSPILIACSMDNCCPMREAYMRQWLIYNSCLISPSIERLDWSPNLNLCLRNLFLIILRSIPQMQWIPWFGSNIQFSGYLAHAYECPALTSESIVDHNGKSGEKNFDGHQFAYLSNQALLSHHLMWRSLSFSVSRFSTHIMIIFKFEAVCFLMTMINSSGSN